MRVNEARKARLFDLARSRMGYQDFLTALNTVERDIEAGWNKRQRQIKASQLKKKKAAAPAGAAPGASQPSGTQGTAPPGSQQAGGAADLEGSTSKVVLPDTVRAAMARRRMLLEQLRPIFDADPLTWRPPEEGHSVYEGLQLDEE